MITLKVSDLVLVRQEEQGKQQAETDRDLLLADVMMANAELQQQLNDLSMVLADLMTGGTGV